jgi:hypothetical protein
MFPTIKEGTNTRNTDVQAAKCITIARQSRIILGDTLQPFNQYISQYNTDHSTNSTVAIPQTVHHQSQCAQT